MSRLIKRRKTITRSFRISQEWEEALEEEAEKQRMSVNVLMNKILRRYALYDRWKEHMRLHDSTVLTQRSLDAILDAADKHNLSVKASNIGHLDIKDILDVMGLPNNYNSFVYLIEKHFGEFAKWFRFFHHSQGREDRFHLEHNLGLSWSIYLQQYLQAYLKSLDNIKFVIEPQDNIVNIIVTRLNSD